MREIRKQSNTLWQSSQDLRSAAGQGFLKSRVFTKTGTFSTSAVVLFFFAVEHYLTTNYLAGLSTAVLGHPSANWGSY